MLGLQLWLNLSRKDKWTSPQYRGITTSLIIKVQEESGIFVVAINKTGVEENRELCGLSMAIDPSGEIVFEIGKEEGEFTTEIDLSLLKKR